MLNIIALLVVLIHADDINLYIFNNSIEDTEK